MSVRFIHILFPLALLVSLTPCKSKNGASSFLWEEAALRVESDPPGATIYVVGKEVGTTPALITKQQLYPAGYDREYKDLYGHIVLKKEGCEDFIKRLVYPTDFKNGIMAKLNCHVVAMR